MVLKDVSVHTAGVFYYAGAATAAGQSYTGALLVSRDGSWPEEKEMDRVDKAFGSCGIKLWELFPVSILYTAGGGRYDLCALGGAAHDRCDVLSQYTI